MVKNEVFGSRKSILDNKLKKIYGGNIKKLWFCTCLKMLNADPQTRYIIFYECFNDNEFKDINVGKIKNFFKQNTTITKVYIDSNKLKFSDISSDKIIEFDFKKEGPNDKAAGYVLERVDCLNGKIYRAKTRISRSPDVTDLSRFLRRDMFGRLASMDIDFIIYLQDRLILIEEKLYLDNGYGSIGLGQFRSLKEILDDVVDLNQNIKWYIMYYDSPNDEWHAYDFKNEVGGAENAFNDHKTKKDYTRNEWRILIPKSKMIKIDVDEFIQGF